MLMGYFVEKKSKKNIFGFEKHDNSTFYMHPISENQSETFAYDKKTNINSTFEVNAVKSNATFSHDINLVSRITARKEIFTEPSINSIFQITANNKGS